MNELTVVIAVSDSTCQRYGVRGKLELGCLNWEQLGDDSAGFSRLPMGLFDKEVFEVCD
jgi:hypothetical protein